jgi:hypothetical protein
MPFVAHRPPETPLVETGDDGPKPAGAAPDEAAPPTDRTTWMRRKRPVPHEDKLMVLSLPVGLEKEGRACAIVFRRYAYREPLYLVPPGKRPWTISVPFNFVTDFASIPWWARWLISPFGRHAKAAVIHDWLYALGPTRERDRKWCDEVFRDALLELGVEPLRAALMYAAVRFGGARSYGADGEWLFHDRITGDWLDPAKLGMVRPTDI